MTINPPKCAVNMEQRLAALRRDQEIDGLRVYLIKYNLFPRNRDPHNSPIRLEELKELVKHWKLHRQRGFWRDHPDKDDLVRALLQHIKSEAANKKRRQEAQDKYRSKALGGADDGSPGKLRDLATFFGEGPGGGEHDREQAVATAKRKNFGGDLFYQRGDYDEGLIYLSRIDKSRFQSESHNPCQDLLTTSASAPTPLNRLLLSSSDGNKTKGASGNALAEKDGERDPPTRSVPAFPGSSSLSPIVVNSASAVNLTKEMKLKSVEGLYSISCHKGYEAQLVREGALPTLSSVLKLDDPAIRLYAAAAILNLTHYIPVPLAPLHTPAKKAHVLSTTSSSSQLTMAPPQATKDLYAKMMDENVISSLLDLMHTPHATVKALCARALLRFTIEEAHHFNMVHDGVVAALSQVMATTTTTVASPLAAPNDVKLLCVLALVNLSGVPRAVTCDALLNVVVSLVKHGDTATRKICAQALLNLSILPTTRGTVVEEGVLGALSVLAAVAVKPMQLTLLESVSCTLCNLSAVKTNQESLSKNNGLNMLSDMLDSVGAELRQMHTTAATNADSGEGEALVLSLLGTIRKNCVNAVAMLCCNPKLHVRIRNAGFIPRLLSILQREESDEDDYSDDEPSPRASGSAKPLQIPLDADTEKFAIIALANLALDDRCRPTLVQDGSVSVFLGLLNAPEVQSEDHRAGSLLLKLDCVTALSNLLLHPANFQALVDAGVVPAFLDLIRNEETSSSTASNSSREIQKACVYAMLGLAKDPGMKTRLAEASHKAGETSDQTGAIPTMLAFASKNLGNAELCGVCISFFHHLSSRPENHELLFFEGTVGLLVRVLQKPRTAEAPATIYTIWLNCLATLAHLASHTSRHGTLLDDGVLEAIQHFLIVSAADQRPRDALTDRSIIKAQYAASQIVFKMHELCSGSVSADGSSGPVSAPADAPAFFACLLLLATQSAAKNSRLSKSTVLIQQRTARRTALTIAKVALAAPHGARLLAEHPDIPPALNMVMRTGIHEAQVCAAIALCNLAAERTTPSKGKPLPRVWRDATVDDFIVITLLRVNSPQTKGICAKALFNLLTHEDSRDQLMKDGVLYALVKLARLENDSIRDLALRALYNISLDPQKTPRLLEMELVRILAKMYQADLHKSMKRLMVGIFSNLSSAPCSPPTAVTNDAFEGETVDEKPPVKPTGTASNVELQMIHEGALGVLKNLARVRDPEMKLFVANVLYNLSCASESRVAELLVLDDSNVVAILVAELKSEGRDVRKYAAKTLANLSASSVAVQAMTSDPSAVVSVINDAMKGAKAKAGATASSKGASPSAASSVCVETNCACVFALRNLFSLEVNQRKFIACNGLPTLAALLATPAMASEAATLRVATDMICSLAKLNVGASGTDGVSYEERLVKDGIVRALGAIAKSSVDGTTSRAEENAACMNIATSLSSLSRNPRCHDGMLRDGALDALAVLCATNAGDTRAPFKGLIGVRGEAFALHCMLTIRNLSRQEPPVSLGGSAVGDGDASGSIPDELRVSTSKVEDVRSQRLAGQPALVPIVLALSQSTSPETREHVVVSLYNLSRLRRSKRQLIKNDGVKVLLRLGTNATTAFKRHVCALALQALSTQSPPPPPAQPANGSDPAAATASATANAADWDEPHVDKVVQEGIVAAIAALADSHQHDLLVSVSTHLYVITEPPPVVTEPVALLRTANRPLEQQGAPPDWGKVLITDLSSWPEIESRGSKTVVHVESALALGAVSSGLQEDEQAEDSYSDASDDEAASQRKSSAAMSAGKLLGPTGTVSPKTTNSSPSALTSALAPPRVCSTDAVLGWFQPLADPKPEKVRVNVEFELVGRRAVTPTPSNTSTASADELPKLRPETAPEGATEAVSKLDGGRNAQSTLTQVRHGVASSSPIHRRVTSNSVYRTTDPIKSPAAAKRRSHQLEPLFMQE